MEEAAPCPRCWRGCWDQVSSELIQPGKRIHGITGLGRGNWVHTQNPGRGQSHQQQGQHVTACRLRSAPDSAAQKGWLTCEEEEGAMQPLFSTVY